MTSERTISHGSKLAQRDRYLRETFTALVRMPLAMCAAAVLLLIVIASVAAPIIAPYGPNTSDFAEALSGPTAAHWLGTDGLGRDVLSRIMYAGNPALLDVVIALGVAIAIAVPTGIATGLAKGWPDFIATRIADILMSIPGIIVILMILAMTQRSMAAAMVGLGVLSAPGLMRIVRGATLAVVEEAYIAAAQVGGLTRPQIAIRHILRRVAGPTTVNSSIIGANAILAAAGLNFIGLGIRPPNPSWGSLLADAATVIDQQSWLLVPTGGVIALTIVAIVLLGDGIRDASASVWSGTPRRQRRTRRGHKLAHNGIARLTEDKDAVGSIRELPAGHELLRVDSLAVSFPRSDGRAEWIRTVDGVSFVVGAGETVGIVGESGCGKTLTGLAILGMLPAAARISSGSIEFKGREVTRLRAREKANLRGSSIAFVSQEPMVALDPLFTVGSQIAEAVRVHRRYGRVKAARAAVELLAQVQINDPEAVAKLYPHQISGGMAQRVAIAIALAGQPDLLVADEPTTALDVTVQAEILSLLRSLQADTGMAILLVSHDMGVISTACDKVIVMYAGQIVESGPVSELVHGPRHPYTHGLLASNPRYAKRGERLQTIKGSVPPPIDWPRNGCHFAERCRFATQECTAARIPLAHLGESRTSRCIHVDDLLSAAHEELDTDETAAQ